MNPDIEKLLELLETTAKTAKELSEYASEQTLNELVTNGFLIFIMSRSIKRYMVK